MAQATPKDSVDVILDQWRRERPDLDISPMGTIARIKRCNMHIQRKLEEVFGQFGLSHREFDVMATLRRSGAPYRLAPTALFSSLMITSGTMTNRLQGLEGRGLIKRVSNPADARSILVQLTPAGLKIIERAIEAHVENEREILSSLPAATLLALDKQLSALLWDLEIK